MAINPLLTTRLTGMSSGMDTDAMVKALSTNQQSKIDALFRKKATAEWKRDAYTDINNLIRTFKDDYISTLGSKSMMKSEAYKTMNIEGSNSAVSVKAASGAATGSHKIEVSRIATGAMHSGTEVSSGRLTTTNVTLKDMAASDKMKNPFETIALTDADGNAILDENGEPVQGYEVRINGQSFQFKETDKLSDVMSKINNNTKAGAKLTYSQLTNTFTLTATKMGESSELTVEEDESGFFAALGLGGNGEGTESVFNPAAGQNAVVMIDGVEMKSETNSFTIDGLNYTLNGPTTSAFEFSVNRDVGKSVEMMKDFVKSFNELVSKLNSYYTTKKNSSYIPLTDEQKEGMSETEATNWDNKAKEGILRRDDGLGRIMEGLRSLVTANVTGAGSLRDIGITGDVYTPGAPFSLVVDEEKLKAALEEDPDKAYNIMTQAAVKASGTTKADAGGILARISAPLDKFTADTKTNNLQTLRDNINDYAKNITDQTDKMYLMQEKLYAKFASFESAMSQMQSQQNQMSGYFGQ